MKLIIAGGRNATEFNVLSAIEDCENWGPFDPADATEVVCGEAAGADREGKLWANGNGIVVKSFPANWNEYGRSAGHIRNAQMADYATHLLAVWDGQSRGTKNMINQANKKGLIVHVFRYKD